MPSRQRRRSIKRWAIGLTTLASLASASSALAAGEALDPTFGQGGSVWTTIGSNPKAQDQIEALALQPDGKIVAAGTADITEKAFNSAIARYLPDGSLDTSFSGDGMLVRDLAGPVADSYDRFEAVMVAPDGKIVAVGSAKPGGPPRFAAMRLTASGAPDLTFDGDGVAMVNQSPTYVGGPYGYDPGAAPDGALAPNGDVIIAGSGEYNTGGSGFGNVAVVRLDTTGAKVSSFADNGVFNEPLPLPPGYQQLASAGAVAVQPDGKIVVVGTAFPSDGGRPQGLVLRLTPGGDLDPSFGGNGIALVPPITQLQEVTVAGDGRILVGGYDDSESLGDFAVARLNAGGSLDPSFAGDGATTIKFDNFFFPSKAEAIAELPDGRILVAGEGEGFPVVRLTQAGEIDSARALFPGTDGTQLVSTGHAMVVQENGKIVLGGMAPDPASFRSSFGLKRVESLGVPDPPEDTTAPKTEIRKVKVDAKRRKVKIIFRGSDDSGAVKEFDCKLDGGSYKDCSSPYSKSKLKPGKHRFQVRARDAAGNVDKSPAKERFKVKPPKKGK